MSGELLDMGGGSSEFRDRETWDLKVPGSCESLVSDNLGESRKPGALERFEGVCIVGRGVALRARS